MCGGTDRGRVLRLRILLRRQYRVRQPADGNSEQCSASRNGRTRPAPGRRVFTSYGGAIVREPVRNRARWQTKPASIAVLLLLALVLWGYVVGPLVSTFQRSITSDRGMFAEYAPFLDFASVQNEAL